MNPTRNRIKAHRRVRAGDLVPHELNPRRHTEAQRKALLALYEEIGFARSLLAYELPDGRLKLIDGHLRQGIDPNMEVEVEVLDVDDAEARALLLSLDPLVLLAGYESETLARLRELTQTESEALRDLWATVEQGQSVARSQLAAAAEPKSAPETVPEQFLVLIECADEKEQLALLERFHEEGLRCRALLS